MLTQLDDDGRKFVVAYSSQSNNKIEVKYSLYVGECFIIIWAVSFFQCYLYGNPFILVFNHQLHKFLMELDWFIGKFSKWAFILQEYLLFRRLVRLIGMLMGWIEPKF